MSVEPLDAQYVPPRLPQAARTSSLTLFLALLLVMLATLLPRLACLERSRPVNRPEVFMLDVCEREDVLLPTLLCLLRCSIASAIARLELRSGRAGIGGSMMLGARDEMLASETGARSFAPKEGGTGKLISAPEDAVRRRW